MFVPERCCIRCEHSQSACVLNLFPVELHGSAQVPRKANPYVLAFLVSWRGLCVARARQPTAGVGSSYTFVAHALHSALFRCAVFQGSQSAGPSHAVQRLLVSCSDFAIPLALSLRNLFAALVKAMLRADQLHEQGWPQAAAQVIKRKGRLKAPWSKIMEACALLDGFGFELPLPTQQMTACRFCIDRLRERNWNIFVSASSPFAFDADARVTLASSEAEFPEDVVSWDPARPCFAQCAPREDEEDQRLWDSFVTCNPGNLVRLAGNRPGAKKAPFTTAPPRGNRPPEPPPKPPKIDKTASKTVLGDGFVCETALESAIKTAPWH